ncbi:MAG: lysozyme inhibitor LprI family protein [Desulfococcaceae bacterium]
MIRFWTTFFAGLFLALGWMGTTPVLADQAAWISRDDAERAARRIENASTIRKFCAPCGDNEWTTVPVRRVEVRNPSGDHHEVAVNGEGMDLAYTYLSENGRWRNLALAMGLEVSGVPEFLATEGDSPGPTPRPEGKNHPLDRELDACLTLDPSTAGMINCLNLAYEKWDAELNRVYQELRRTLDPEGRKALQGAQRTWMAYRDAEFGLMERIYGPGDGSLARVGAAANRVEFIRTRVLALSGYLE